MRATLRRIADLPAHWVALALANLVFAAVVASERDWQETVTRIMITAALLYIALLTRDNRRLREDLQAEREFRRVLVWGIHKGQGSRR